VLTSLPAFGHAPVVVAGGGRVERLEYADGAVVIEADDPIDDAVQYELLVCRQMLLTVVDRLLNNAPCPRNWLYDVRRAVMHDEPMPSPPSRRSVTPTIRAIRPLQE